MATGSSSSVTTQQYPVDMAEMIKQLQGQIGGLNTGQATQENLNSLMNNPLSSELFTGTIGPILNQLKDSEGQSRTALADQFRMAGGGQGGALQSGAFANAATRNEQNILANRSNVVANKASEVFRNLLSGLGLGLNAEQAQEGPTKLGLGLLGAVRPTTTTTQGSNSSDAGTVGGISDPFGMLNYSSGSNITTGPTLGGSRPLDKEFYGGYGGGGMIGPNYDPIENEYSKLRSQEYERQLAGWNADRYPSAQQTSYPQTFTGIGSGLNPDQMLSGEY